MKAEINPVELQERIALNYTRLTQGDYYQFEQIFAPVDYEWPGDKEGRALLAFVSHYKINGKKADCMNLMINALDDKLGDIGYLGKAYNGIIDEQQLSGHSWLLRGLCEYYEQFKDERIISAINKITTNLYMPLKGITDTYPIVREVKDEGGVSGLPSGIMGIWNLSTDIGCAFMSIDGLSHVYSVTGDKEIKALVDEMTDFFLTIDKKALRMQTHCTLSAARGMIRMYNVTGEDRYLDGAKDIYKLYVNGGGMTYTYHNLNWWQRPDTWTEPCAVVDSLILALELYKATGNEEHRTVAARIYHNGFATMQRDNGGAGTDTVVYPGGCDYLAMSNIYEAYFCCTMRLAEGLWYANENKDLLYANISGNVTKDEKGVYADGDIIYCQPAGGAEEYGEGFVEVDGLRLCPIVKYYRMPKAVIESSKLKIIF